MVSTRPLRLVVDVTPRLFGDALSRALHGDAVDVVAMADVQATAAAARERSFDLAVTCGPLPEGVTADRVIHVASADSSNFGSRPTATSAVGVGDLQQLLTLVRQHRSVL